MTGKFYQAASYKYWIESYAAWNVFANVNLWTFVDMSLNVRRTNEEKTLNRDVSEHFNKNQAYIKSIYALKRNKLTNNVVKIVNTHTQKISWRNKR